MNNVRIGVIGIGGMGGFHVNNLLQGKIKRATLAAVCDIDEKHLVKHRDLKTFLDSGEMIRSGEVDAVMIATPHYFHTTIGIDALEQGLHVLVEKPISVHKADCERLIAAHTNPKQVFAAMFNQRTDPHYIRVRKLIQDGELGTITRVSWIITDWFRTEFYYASGGWRATWSGEGGGVLLNQCPHNLDLLQWLVGMPSKVRGFCGLGVKHNIEVEDQVTAYLEFPNGATGVFITTTGEAPGTNRLEIAGERGKVVVEDGNITFTRNEEPMTEFSRTVQAGFAKPAVWNVNIPVDGFGGQHADILQNFVDAILDGTPLIAPAEEGINSVELANAMLYSSLTNSTVTLPLDAAGFAQKLQELIDNSKFTKVVNAHVEADMTKSFH
ncbi:MAG TPA: Gfo/Idh/MocA family oxidoreductase [Armatimonadota bacterium]